MEYRQCALWAHFTGRLRVVLRKLGSMLSHTQYPPFRSEVAPSALGAPWICDRGCGRFCRFLHLSRQYSIRWGDGTARSKECNQRTRAHKMSPELLDAVPSNYAMHLPA